MERTIHETTITHTQKAKRKPKKNTRRNKTSFAREKERDGGGEL
jgi:hypothetical protein